MYLRINVWDALRTAHTQSTASFVRLFFHSGDVLRVIVLVMTVQGWTDAKKELERVAEIVAVIAIQAVGAVVDGELGSETNVNTIAVR